MLNVQLLEHNDKGRDFVVGDVHGMYNSLVQALANLNFDESKDRLFSVGDIIDRGPRNIELLEMFGAAPYYIVMGNHEELMVRSVLWHQDMPRRVWLSNGGLWSADVDPAKLNKLAEKASSWPDVIVVAGPPGEEGFNVVHAELLVKDQKAIFSTNSTDIEGAAHWGSSIFMGEHNPNNNRRVLWKTFVGHMSADEPSIVGAHNFLDTGAAYRKKLSIIDVNSGEITSHAIID